MIFRFYFLLLLLITKCTLAWFPLHSPPSAAQEPTGNAQQRFVSLAWINSFVDGKNINICKAIEEFFVYLTTYMLLEFTRVDLLAQHIQYTGPLWTQMHFSK